MSDPRRLHELREKFRKPEPVDEGCLVDFWEPAIREKFNVGDEVYVRCKVVGPALLAYGDNCIVLDLVALDSSDEETGARFTVTPAEAFWPYELMPRA